MQWAMEVKREREREREGEGTAAEQENEEKKRIFDFIDSFRYTPIPSPSPSPSLSPLSSTCRGSNADANCSKASSSFLISKNKCKHKRMSKTGTANKRTPTRKRRSKDQSPALATSKPPSTSKSKSQCRRSSLTAAEKVMEAYRRVPPGFTFTPPPSPHRLLQEDHAFDPWRVLVICMLLNNTTGAQVKKVVDDLFALCPDAHTTLQVGVHLIEHVIHSLGLQKKRARMIKILSQEYLDPDWTHVTSLHGVGKYAADAYAIFCTGKGPDVRPDDHKLVDYWNSIYGNGSGLTPHLSTSSAQLCSTDHCCWSQVPPSCSNPAVMIDFWSDED